MRFIPFLLVFVMSLISFSCKQSRELSPQEEANYLSEIEEWHHNRITSLRSEEGWLNLAGLYWLSPGMNTFGTSASVDIQFPQGSVPAIAGYFNLESKRVTLQLKNNSGVTVNGETVQRAEVFNSGSTKKIIMASGNYRWTIIKREDKYGIRLRNLQHPRLETFHGIERFPVDLRYRLTARFQVTDTLRYLPITNVLGQTTNQLSPGTLVFEWEGKTYTLDVIDEGNEGDYFIIMADKTSGKSTYAAGRFLYVSRPDAKGEVIVDFNKAYNPPCVFSPFATCPLPPKQNHLEFAVEAGEKDFHLD